MLKKAFERWRIRFSLDIAVGDSFEMNVRCGKKKR